VKRTRLAPTITLLVCCAAVVTAPSCGTGAQSTPTQPPTATSPDTPPPQAAPATAPATKPAPTNTGPAATRPAPRKAAGPQGALKGILAAHNRVRAQHCVPPLKWSKKLAAYAQQWANKLRDQNCAFNHRQRSPYGENLSMYGPPGGTSADEITMGWYNEIKHYSFRRPRFSFQTGHFTQVIWRTTTELGCGRAVCSAAEIWVCNYAPPGNVGGEFKRNVPPRCK